ncbi:hypothetical protein BDF14DRAFT_1417176 [Spinellus fusiger]|nr:hypothetical protein BDF14DRAFT_1417176 [Spinellus fusiger]
MFVFNVSTMPSIGSSLILPSSMASPNRVFLSPIPIHPRHNRHSNPRMNQMPQEVHPHILSKEFALVCDAYSRNTQHRHPKEKDSKLIRDPTTDTSASILPHPPSSSSSMYSVSTNKDSTIATSLSSENSLLSRSSTFSPSQPLHSSHTVSQLTKSSIQLFKWNKSSREELVGDSHQEQQQEQQQQQQQQQENSPCHNRRWESKHLSFSSLPTALYYGSRKVRRYLGKVMIPHSQKSFDDMLQHGFACSHTYAAQDTEDNDSVRTTTTDTHDMIDIPNKPCTQCGPDQRQMTLRITLTPWHCRATETEIYGQTMDRRGHHSSSDTLPTHLQKSLSTASKVSSSWLSHYSAHKYVSPLATQSMPIPQKKAKKRQKRDVGKTYSLVPIPCFSAVPS